MNHHLISASLSAALSLSVLSFGLMSCAELTGEDEVNAQDKVINGQNDSGHPYVVSLTNANGSSSCTGTLISSSVVLTAAHCIYSRQYGLHPPAFIEIGTFVGAAGNTRVPVSAYPMHEG